MDAYTAGVRLALADAGFKLAAMLTEPFKLVPDRKLSPVELAAAIRQAIISEHDAVAQYTLQADAVSDPVVRKVLLDIADEERVHIGELSRLLQRLTKDENDKMNEGAREVLKTIAQGSRPLVEGTKRRD